MTDCDPVRLLKDLIRCPSVTPEAAGVLDVLDAALSAAGFAVTRLRFEGDGSYPVDNLFATRGSGGRHLLFAGHTDVVPPGNAADWRDDPFSAAERDGLIFGRGAADMKSGVAAFVAAAIETDAGGTISLAITNDEEADAVNGTEKLLAWAAGQGLRFDFCIVGEPSAAGRVGDRIKIGRRGSLNGRVTVRGVQGHSAYPENATNPIPVLAEVVDRLGRATLDAGSAAFQPSNLEFTSVDVGNPATNVIPAAGTAAFNIRYNDGWTPETLVAWVRARLAEIDPRGTAIAFEIVGRPSRSFLSPPGEALAVLDRLIAARLGAPPEHSTTGGTSDARFIASHCPVIELGLPGATMHKVDECVAVANVLALRDLYAAFIDAYLNRQ